MRNRKLIMHSTHSSSAPLPGAGSRRLGRRFLWGLLGVQAINLVCALLITGLALTRGSFAVNLVFSMCIGTLAYSFINGGRILIWGQDVKPPIPAFLALMVGGLLLAQWLGMWSASWLTGTEDAARHISGGGAVLLLMCLLAGATASWLFWNRARLAWLKAEAESEKARAAAIEKQAVQAQLQLLQAQVEPHMLFNTLANLQGLITIDPPRAQLMLDQLIQYLRATLSAARAANTTLGQEFALLQAYLALMQMRMGERLRIELDLPLDCADLSVPPMLVQPLVENAIKHGLEPKLEGGSIRVRAQRQAQHLLITVEDDGLGLEANGTSGTRVGLANLRERLEVLYGGAARFELRPGQPGAVAILNLPLP
jgi:hypothetical protein